MTRDGFDTLVPTPVAARLVGVSPATVRKWAQRGHLMPADRTPSGRPLYRARDVFDAERATRRRDDGTRAVESRSLRRR